jgi:hypothetical protein
MKLHNIIVKSGEDVYTISVEEMFDDLFVEACTRVVEYKRKTEKNLALPPFMFAQRDRKNAKETTCNTYIILMNSGLYLQAENLRKIFKNDSGVDLEKEPARSK